MPWELFALQRVQNRKEAMDLEWKIKRSKGARLRWLEENKTSNS